MTPEQASRRDLERLLRFARNEGVLVPADGEDHPLRLGEQDGRGYYACFESAELGRTSTALEPASYTWGRISGLKLLEFLAQRAAAGGSPVLILNPGTALQVGLDEAAIRGFLTWLARHPEGIET